MRAHVDKDLCIGCGLCADICPEVFSMDDDGTAIAIDGEIAETDLDSAQEAKEQCPVDAITIE